MSVQQLTANRAELGQSFTGYENWVLNSALKLAVAAGDRKAYGEISTTEAAEAALLKYLAPIAEEPVEYSLPMFLSPDRPETQLEDTADTARLVQALYGSATDLKLYVSANQTHATVLVIGEKETVPNKYLVSIVEAEADRLTVSEAKRLPELRETLKRHLIAGV